MYHNRLYGFNRFKNKVNFILHRILLGIFDKNVVRTERIPKYMFKLVKLADFGKDEKVKHIRKTIIISLLNVYRLLKVDPALDVESIVGAYEGTLPLYDNTNNKTEEFLSYLKVCCNILSPKVNRSLSKSFNLNFTLSAGPNNSIALEGLFKDIKAVYSSHLYPILLQYNKGDPGFLDFNSFIQRVVQGSCNSTYFHSRLHLLQDKGCKTRNIAIGDMCTQSTLRPLHNNIFRLLKSLNTDGTKDQISQVNRISRYLHYNCNGRLFTLSKICNDNRIRIPDTYQLSDEFNSIDMKSCTERFPVSLQKHCLYYLGFLSKEDSDL